MLAHHSSAVMHAASHYVRVGSLYSLYCPLVPAKQSSQNLLPFATACTRHISRRRQWRQARPQQSTNFRCVHRNIYHIIRTCQFFRRPRELGLRTKYLRDDPKKLHLRLRQALRSRCSCAIALLVFGTRGARLLRSENPDTLVDDSSFIGLLLFSECYVAGSSGHRHPPRWIPDWPLELLRLRWLTIVRSST